MFPTLNTFLGIPGQVFLVAAVIISVAVFVRAITLKVVVPVRQGTYIYRFDRWPQRVKAVLHLRHRPAQSVRQLLLRHAARADLLGLYHLAALHQQPGDGKV